MALEKKKKGREQKTCFFFFFRNYVGEPGRKMKMKVLLRPASREPLSAPVFAHGSVCLRSCTVQVCRVPSTSRLIER